MADANHTNPTHNEPHAAAHGAGSNVTPWSYLPTIFAQDRTGELTPERLESICRELNEHIVGAMGSIGELLARAEEPSEYSVTGAGWLLRGLADIYTAVSLANTGDKRQMAGDMKPDRN